MNRYLAIYLAVGAAICATAIIRGRGSDFRALLTEIRQEPLRQFAGFLVVILLWPVVPSMLVYDWIAHRLRRRHRSVGPVDRPTFRVTPEHLRQRLSVAEIEAAELVQDPLNAVPNLAFGHLNAAWQAFASGLQPDDEIWRFEAEWRPEFETSKRLRGYAAVRHGAVAAYFTCGSRTLDND